MTDSEITEAVLNRIFPMGRSDVGRDHSRETMPRAAIKYTLELLRSPPHQDSHTDGDEVRRLREALGNMLDFYWGYRKNDGAHEITDELAQKYQDELIEGQKAPPVTDGEACEAHARQDQLRDAPKKVGERDDEAFDRWWYEQNMQYQSPRSHDADTWIVAQAWSAALSHARQSPGWETPAQYEARTGERVPDEAAVWVRRSWVGSNQWTLTSLCRRDRVDTALRNGCILLARTAMGPPPEDWENHRTTGKTSAKSEA